MEYGCEFPCSWFGKFTWSVQIRRACLCGKAAKVILVFILCVLMYDIKTVHVDYHQQTTVSSRLERKLKLVGKDPNLDKTDNCTRDYPGAIIIGVMKGGTEAFSTFLAIHPQIAMQFQMRATLFFTLNYNKGFEWYRQRMSCKISDQITVEKSPQYWTGHETPKRIYQFNKNIKLILIIRNPIDRSLSHFLQQNNSNPEKLKGKTFEENVINKKGEIDSSSGFIQLSKYSVTLKHWLKYFKLDQILIVDGDNFRENPAQELAKAEKFLGIQPYITAEKFEFNDSRNISCIKTEENENSCLPQGKGRSHPNISPYLLKKLHKQFSSYNEEFFEMTGRKFDW